jgi:hypothetical protein
MTYFAYIPPPAVVDDGCEVIVLASFDVRPFVNEAPYFLNDPGIYDPSLYELTADSMFGAGAMACIGSDIGGWNMEIFIDDIDFEYPHISFNGKVTIEWRMRRPGGMQGTGLGNSESSAVFFWIYTESLNDLYVQFGHRGTDFTNPGTGFQVWTDDEGAPTSVITSGWTDDSYHVMAVCVNVDVAYLFQDGVLIGSRSLPNPLNTVGEYCNGCNINLFKTFPATTDEVDIDEVRIMINRSLYTTDYAVEFGAWIDDACDSDVEAPTVDLLNFDDQTGALPGTYHGYTVTNGGGSLVTFAFGTSPSSPNSLADAGAGVPPAPRLTSPSVISRVALNCTTGSSGFTLEILDIDGNSVYSASIGTSNGFATFPRTTHDIDPLLNGRTILFNGIAADWAIDDLEITRAS